MGLPWAETVVLGIVSWGKVGCLGCFVDSRLQICNSSNRWVRVFFLVHPSDGMEGGLTPFFLCDVVRKVFCPIFLSGFGQCV